MALWASVQQLKGEAMSTVQSVYGSHFPIEVRHFFAQWMEQQPWNEVDEDNSEHEQRAIGLRDMLIQLMEEKATELSTIEDMFLTRLKLQETTQQFKIMYGNHPMNLVRVVKNCLATETRMIQQTEQQSGDKQGANMHASIMQQFEFLFGKTQETENELRQSQHKQESFVIQYQESFRIEAQLNQLTKVEGPIEAKQRLQQEKEAIAAKLSGAARELLFDRVSLLQKFKENCNNLRALQSHILDDQLIFWKRQQQLAGNGAPFEASLETLQQWCEKLAELVWRNYQQLGQMNQLFTHLPIDLPPEQKDVLPFLTESIYKLLETLITSTFVIEKQPTQVLKKDSRFTATARSLIGSRLNLHMTLPQVTATIVSEEQARAILNNDKNARRLTSGNILNNKGTMEYHQASGQLSITFRNLVLKTIRRAEKKGNETVTEEKFSILFQTVLTINSDLVYDAWTLSLPVVVIVHGNQNCNAQATILWDNQFADGGRLPFQVADKVTWQQLSQALNTPFTAECSMGLSRDNLLYLASKIFNTADDYSNHLVSWTQFNREPLPGRSFTFWEWFHSIQKLTKDWLQGPWKDRLILGFINKQVAEQWLMQSRLGTFMLRFSDSELGGISISLVNEDRNQPCGRAVTHLTPFKDSDLRIRGLGDRVNDLMQLVFLYPDIPKERAFQKYCTAASENPSYDSGYVKPDLTTTIPGLSKPAPHAIYDDPSSIPCGSFQANSPAPSDMNQMTSPQPQMKQELMSPGPPSNFNLMDDASDLIEFNMLDYNSEDIAEINVNELLSLNPQGLDFPRTDL
ncbi:hypothetical protein CAPTEDRAFT_223577 [Capitella teleta]|uniref:Signal transducer and activator of transcription n=1 Tax=Capitella teleta TaxID=283909 RepID=R7UYT8_CAPTE|nr:hypothetical protein CAPTEDRAFT_223577 [Capitella teleta]|eukprot:ELU09097.1 hypothetical protein CAPTEDRAFT_223577 [Capitella teleta]